MTEEIDLSLNITVAAAWISSWLDGLLFVIFFRFLRRLYRLRCVQFNEKTVDGKNFLQKDFARVFRMRGPRFSQSIKRPISRRKSGSGDDAQPRMTMQPARAP